MEEKEKEIETVESTNADALAMQCEKDLDRAVQYFRYIDKCMEVIFKGLKK